MTVEVTKEAVEANARARHNSHAARFGAGLSRMLTWDEIPECAAKTAMREDARAGLIAALPHLRVVPDVDLHTAMRVCAALGVRTTTGSIHGCREAIAQALAPRANEEIKRLTAAGERLAAQTGTTFVVDPAKAGAFATPDAGQVRASAVTPSPAGARVGAGDLAALAEEAAEWFVSMDGGSNSIPDMAHNALVALLRALAAHHRADEAQWARVREAGRCVALTTVDSELRTLARAMAGE